MVFTELKTEMRPFTFDDAQACIDLFNARSLSLYGQKDSQLDDLMREWTAPGFIAEEAIRVVENAQGEIIGYIDLYDVTSPHIVKWVWGVLHPDFWDDALFYQMLAWAEDLGRKRITLAPEDARVVMKQGTSSMDLRLKKALETYGFNLVRHFYRMEIELTQPPQKPVFPPGIRIEPIAVETELKDAIIAIDEAFKDHWGHVSQQIEQMLEQWEHYLENDKDFDPSLWWLAKDGDQIAGICRCAGKTVEDPEMGWVQQLGVLKPWRRQGLGMALLLAAFNEFYQRGKQRAGLAVDASSLTNATRLYLNAGMHVSRQYDMYEMELRPGKEIATTNL